MNNKCLITGIILFSVGIIGNSYLLGAVCNHECRNISYFGFYDTGKSKNICHMYEYPDCLECVITLSGWDGCVVTPQQFDPDCKENKSFTQAWKNCKDGDCALACKAKGGRQQAVCSEFEDGWTTLSRPVNECQKSGS